MRKRNKMGKILGVAIVCLMIGTMVWGTVSAEQPYYATKEAVPQIDRELVEMIDTYAGDYFVPEWNITLSQYKAWIALIALMEGGNLCYAAHSSWGIGSDFFYHIDPDAKDSFAFSTGIGPFQMDLLNDGEIDWAKQPTINKSNPEKALKGVLRWHNNSNSIPDGANLATFSEKSMWNAVKPDQEATFAPVWKTMTGKEWNYSKENKHDATISDKVLKDDAFSKYVRYAGKVQWDCKVQTDKRGNIPFQGDYDTWLIRARANNPLAPSEWEYYYTYDEEKQVEVWVWNNESQSNPLRYIFARDLLRGRYPEGPFPASPDKDKAGETLTKPALKLETLRPDRILFDDTHDTDNDELTGADANYRRLKQVLEDKSYLVEELDTAPIRNYFLANYNVLILPDVELELSETEVRAMKNYLNSGGRILIIGEWKGAHLPGSVSKISQVMGIKFNDTIIYDPDNYYENTNWVIIHNIDTSHEIGNGLSNFTMYAGSSLNFTSKTPKAIAGGDSNTYTQDPNGGAQAPDNQVTVIPSTKVASQSLPQRTDIIILASSKFPVAGGEARLVCIGDSDLWKTMTDWEWTDYDPIENYDNKKLLLNIINWLAAPSPPQKPTTKFGIVSQEEMSTFAISVPETAKQLNIELTWPGSDLDLHLYDPQGRHIGYNYTTDQEEIGIQGATYSGRTAKPEWINVTLSSQSGEWTVGVYGYQVEGAYEFYKTESLTDITPPTISNVHHLPSSPTEQDTVNVYTDVIDDVAVQSVTCHWTVDFVNWTTITMSKQSNTYKTDSPIPSHPTGTTVYYYIKATDTSGHETTNPKDAPISTHSYGVTALVPAPVPTLSPIGILALVGLLSVIAISKIRRRWK